MELSTINQTISNTHRCSVDCAYLGIMFPRTASYFLKPNNCFLLLVCFYRSIVTIRALTLGTNVSCCSLHTSVVCGKSSTSALSHVDHISVTDDFLLFFAHFFGMS